jgi:carbohydrate diacid regulator
MPDKKLTDVDIKVIIEFANNNMNVSETARHLFMHRNTVIYHLEKVKQITGLSPFNFYDLIQLLKESNEE